MTAPALPCSEQSLAADEPLAGSAAERTSRWLLLEVPAAWTPKPLAEGTPALPEPLREILAGLPKAAPGTRPQLIRRPSGRADATRRAFVMTPEHGLRELAPVASADEWLDRERFDFAALCGGDDGALSRAGATAAHDGPLWLVCTHGKRDRCCAKLGLPVLRALEAAEPARDAVWQTTHLGGHRFAATLLHLPSGYCFGRVEVDDAAELVAAAAAGEVRPLARVRGRCAYDKAAQAADVALRARLGLAGTDALRLVGSAPEGDDALAPTRWRAVFVDPEGTRHEVTLAKRPAAGLVQASCARQGVPAPAAEVPSAWTVA